MFMLATTYSYFILPWQQMYTTLKSLKVFKTKKILNNYYSMRLQYSLSRLLTTLRRNAQLLPNSLQVLNRVKSTNIFVGSDRCKILETISKNSLRPLIPYVYNSQHPTIVSDVYQINKNYRINYLSSLKNIFQTTKLKLKYDPDFNIESFKKGTKQVRN